MVERSDCADDIAGKTGRARQDVEDDLAELLNRAGEEGPKGSPNFGKASQRMLEEAAERYALKKRQQVENLMKLARAKKQIRKAPNRALGIEALLDGVNTPFDGHRDSIANDALTLQLRWSNGLSQDLDRAGLTKLFASRAIEKEWGRELHELNIRDADPNLAGRPGVTKNPEALAIAKIVQKWQGTMMQAQNDAGAWIKSYSGFVSSLWHDADKIRKAADQAIRRVGGDERDRIQWVHDVLEGLDVKRTFGTNDRQVASEILGRMWINLKNGDHSELIPDPEEPVFPNLAAKASAHRELHWRTFDAFLAYNEKYGSHDLTRQVAEAGLQRAAQRTALLSRLGTKPRQAFEELMAYFKLETKERPERAGLDASESYLRNLYNQIDHSDNKLGNQMIADLATGWMTWQRAAKLGRVFMTHLAGLQTVPSALRHVGLSFGERYAAIFQNFFRGMDDSAKRQVGDLMLEGESVLQRAFNRDISKPGFLGKISALENIRFALTGTSRLLENQRRGAETLMAYHFGKQREVEFADLGDYERNILRGYNIGAPEWDLLRQAQWSTFDDAGTPKTYLTPDVARAIPDNAMRDYLDSRRTRWQRDAAPLPDADIAAGRENLVQKLHALYYDQGRYAMFEPSARARAFMYGGLQQTRPNLYIAAKLFWQFRTWPLEMFYRTWGREFYGGQNALNKVAGITELIVGSIVFGTFAEGLREVVQGQNPVAGFTSHPIGYLARGFTRSGGGTLLGDFLLGEQDRHGHSFLASAAGPTYGQLEDLFALKTEVAKQFGNIYEGNPTHWGGSTAEAIRLLRSNAPFIDIWWSGKAFDYLLLYRLQEWLNPGYLERMERRMKEKSGIEFFLSPQKVAS